MLYFNERKKLAKFAKTLFDRKETNSAGGNISEKINEDHFIMTPTLMSENFHANLRPDQILVVDKNENIVEGDGELTREINMHMACYRTNPKIGAVLHAHALESMTFATIGIDMPNLTEATQKLGRIKCLPYKKGCSQELADQIGKEVKEDMQIPKAYLINKHGILVVDSTLEKVFDQAERLEWNAKIAKEAFAYKKLKSIS